MTSLHVDRRPGRMSVAHATVVGAAMLGFLFALFWASEAAGLGPSTRFLHALAQSAVDTTLAALIAGLPIALVFGAIGGCALALFANLFHFLDRR